MRSSRVMLLAVLAACVSLGMPAAAAGSPAADSTVTVYKTPT